LRGDVKERRGREERKRGEEEEHPLQQLSSAGMDAK
jgi:hypothetical protein